VESLASGRPSVGGPGRSFAWRLVTARPQTVSRRADLLEGRATTDWRRRLLPVRARLPRISLRCTNLPTVLAARQLGQMPILIIPGRFGSIRVGHTYRNANQSVTLIGTPINLRLSQHA
jgi:hypothetical protein